MPPLARLRASVGGIGALLALSGVRSASAQEWITLANRKVAIWKPSATTRAPLVVFSHGFGGCAAQSRFLTEALAERGYFVVAPDHRDARCGSHGERLRPEEPFAAPAKWTDATYADRRDDIIAIVSALRATPALAYRIDFSRIGLVGHSLGGYTVLGLSGAWPSWKLENVRAVLALSPVVQPYLVHQTLAGLRVPVMYQGGTADLGITPWIVKKGGAYDASPAPRYFVELTRASHFAWTNLNPVAHDVILGYALPFLDRYLRDVNVGMQLTVQHAGIAQLRFDTMAVARQ
ncbi:MAG TPA: alpha/beta fold hydrolase [Gemmatimonadaceae bacterium]|nr:alpha/beta fold hydrolase [Gemmatimonadaceae bacterium]